MQIFLLHLDSALKSQANFITTCKQDSAKQIELEEEGQKIRLWGRKANFSKVQEKIAEHFANVRQPQLVFIGSGDFHHITALLLTETLKNTSEEITVLHFDNHPDWVKCSIGMSCGSWVNNVAENPQVAKIITIGVCSKDLKNPKYKGANLGLLTSGKLKVFPYKPRFNSLKLPTISEIGEQKFVEILLSLIKTKAVYITIDKDVLAKEDAKTNWDQGVMRLEFLLQLLQVIGKKHLIIGADVTGDYSHSRYSGNLFTRFLKKLEVMIDQPACKTDITTASDLNSATNHAILEVLSGVMA
jgi:arginase family enzyme